jgi:hypothetical protein
VEPRWHTQQCWHDERICICKEAVNLQQRVTLDVPTNGRVVPIPVVVAVLPRTSVEPNRSPLKLTRENIDVLDPFITSDEVIRSDSRCFEDK